MNGPEKLNAALDFARKHSKQLLTEAMKLQQGDDGEVYGMDALEGGDFLAFYEDLRNREFQIPGTPIPDENGQPAGEIPGPIVNINILEMLRGINPKLAESYDRQAEKERARFNRQVS